MYDLSMYGSEEKSAMCVRERERRVYKKYSSFEMKMREGKNVEECGLWVGEEKTHKR